MVAKVLLLKSLTLTLKFSVLLQNSSILTTHISVIPTTAHSLLNRPLLKSLFKVTNNSPPIAKMTCSGLLLILDPLSYQLMLPNSLTTNLVFSLDAVLKRLLTSTMLSLSSVMVLIQLKETTGSLETLGVTSGVKMVILE